MGARKVIGWAIRARALVLVLSAVLAGASVAEEAAAYQEGRHYVRLPMPVETRDPDRIEVVELFSYGCIHCFNFDPAVERWLETVPDDVDFHRIPAVFNAYWAALAQAFYTAELLDVMGEVHTPIFEGVHVYRLEMNRAELLARLFEREADVDREEFLRVFGSFGVQSRVRKADASTRMYRATGVPTMIVNGTYRIETDMAGGQEQMLDVVDYLVATIRAAE
ncbi:MAG: thiol:disulfide interchange protein DsbA/DsbL [Gammaproteobacteria bacterium]|nr:thiol:disulfide interchange protein DsbA/DsbL [Gammaproteobacteria bacterium]MYB39371.1 thiol:disulfide interchange protein DsbA/DsbL [Gammaproteobacteria bacterium]